MFDNHFTRVALASVLACFLSAALAFGETKTYTSGGCTLTLDTATGLMTVAATPDGNGKMADYEHCNDQPWRADSTAITKVLIESSVKKLGILAFQGCISLAGVEWSAGCQLTELPARIFQRAALTSITIPASVISFGVDDKGSGSQFRDCTSLTEVIWEDGGHITDIPSNCFYKCSVLESITIPASVTSFSVSDSGVGSQFRECTSLTEVIWADGGHITSIPCQCFYKCSSLEEITIPASVTSIRDSNAGTGNQFKGCTSLKKVIWADGGHTECLGFCTFQDCTSLKSITIPASVKHCYVGGTLMLGQTFQGCTSLEEVIWAEGCQLTELPPSMFKNTGIISITIPSSVTSFGTSIDGYGQQFQFCSKLKEVIWEDGGHITELPCNVFDSCSSLESITIPASVTKFGKNTSPVSGSTLIGQGTQFSNCTKLKEVIWEDGGHITELPYMCFYGCISLESIIIPASVTTIGKASNGAANAFRECTKLKTIIFAGATPPELEGNGGSTFYNDKAITDIIVPFGAGEAYETFKNNTTINNGSTLSTAVTHEGELVSIWYAGAATACYTQNTVLKPLTDITPKAYYVKQTARGPEKFAVMDDVMIPANTGVLVESGKIGHAILAKPETEGEINYNWEKAASKSAGNLLIPNLTGIPTFEGPVSGKKFYVLSTGSAGTGFYYDRLTGNNGDSAVCPPYKAVLGVTSSSPTPSSSYLNGGIGLY